MEDNPLVLNSLVNMSEIFALIYDVTFKQGNNTDGFCEFGIGNFDMKQGYGLHKKLCNVSKDLRNAIIILMYHYIRVNNYS